MAEDSPNKEQMPSFRDRLMPFASTDQRMAFAIEEACRSLETFFSAMANPKPNQKSFLIKARFETDRAVEHLWLADIKLSAWPPTGIIANEPRNPRLAFMQRVDFLPDQVTDWMYVEDG